MESAGSFVFSSANLPQLPAGVLLQLLLLPSSRSFLLEYIPPLNAHISPSLFLPLGKAFPMHPVQSGIMPTGLGRKPVMWRSLGVAFKVVNPELRPASNSSLFSF